MDRAFECHRKRRIRGDVASAAWRSCRLVVFGAVSGKGSDAWADRRGSGLLLLSPPFRRASRAPSSLGSKEK